MGKPKINDRKLLQLIDKENKSQSQAAKILGVSRQTVNQRLQELRGRTTRVVVAKETEKALQLSFDAVEQLHTINQKTLKLLDQAEEDGDFSLRCISEL